MSKQICQFAYRFPERPGIIYQMIPIGGQIRVSPNGTQVNLSTLEIDAVINQHHVYGIVSVDDIDRLRGPFDGICYSIGKPITVEKLRRAMVRKDDSLKEFGKTMRQEAALAVNSQIEEQIGSPLRELEMSFQEEEPKGGYSDTTDHVAEGVRVTREVETKGRRGRR
jgi:hypothetical protein